MKKKYLVLGSEGQVGLALVKYLKEQGHIVYEFDIARNEKEDLRIYNINRDLNFYLSESDFVFFLAFDVGGSTYLKKYQNTYEFISNNVKIMNNVFDLLRLYENKFIFTSSQMSNMNYSSYGTLKALGEYYTKALNGLIVKFWNVYGIEQDPTKTHVITDFILKAKNYRCIDMLTDGTEMRQFLYAEDACEALYLLSENYAEVPRDEELHITSFKWNTVSEVAHVIANYFQETLIKIPYVKDTVQMDKRNEPDSFIKRYWQPKTSIEEGIAKIIKDMEKK
jgi:nucleoside-diphosphate-sugar epimerase